MPRYIEQTTVLATPTAVSYGLGIHEPFQTVSYFFHAGSGSDLGGAHPGTNLVEISLQQADTATAWKTVARVSAGVTSATIPHAAQSIRFTVTTSGSVSPFYAWQVLQLGQ